MFSSKILVFKCLYFLSLEIDKCLIFLLHFIAVCVLAPSVSVCILAVAFLHNHAGHALDAVGPVVLVVSLPGHVLQILHVSADEHVPKLHEITVCRVLHCKATVLRSIYTIYIYNS